MLVDELSTLGMFVPQVKPFPKWVQKLGVSRSKSVVLRWTTKIDDFLMFVQ